MFDFVKEYPAARKQLAQWLSEGKLKRQETVVKGGLKVAEQALVDLFKGGNTGKTPSSSSHSPLWKLTRVGKLLVEVKSPEEKSKL